MGRGGAGPEWHRAGQGGRPAPSRGDSTLWPDGAGWSAEGFDWGRLEQNRITAALINQCTSESLHPQFRPAFCLACSASSVRFISAQAGCQRSGPSQRRRCSSSRLSFGPRFLLLLRDSVSLPSSLLVREEGRPAHVLEEAEADAFRWCKVAAGGAGGSRGYFICWPMHVCICSSTKASEVQPERADQTWTAGKI